MWPMMRIKLGHPSIAGVGHNLANPERHLLFVEEGNSSLPLPLMEAVDPKPGKCATDGVLQKALEFSAFRRTAPATTAFIPP